jgi:hypothetical protein
MFFWSFEKSLTTQVPLTIVKNHDCSVYDDIAWWAGAIIDTGCKGVGAICNWLFPISWKCIC